VSSERWDRDRADPLVDGLIEGLAELLVDAGRTVLMLDTISGSEADRLYRSVGWTELGSVPNYATMPDGELAPTTFFYREL